MQCLWSEWLELPSGRSHDGTAIGTHSGIEPATKYHNCEAGITASKLVFEKIRSKDYFRGASGKRLLPFAGPNSRES